MQLAIHGRAAASNIFNAIPAAVSAILWNLPRSDELERFVVLQRTEMFGDVVEYLDSRSFELHLESVATQSHNDKVAAVKALIALSTALSSQLELPDATVFHLRTDMVVSEDRIGFYDDLYYATNIGDTGYYIRTDF